MSRLIQLFWMVLIAGVCLMECYRNTLLVHALVSVQQANAELRLQILARDISDCSSSIYKMRNDSNDTDSSHPHTWIWGSKWLRPIPWEDR